MKSIRLWIGSVAVAAFAVVVVASPAWAAVETSTEHAGPIVVGGTCGAAAGTPASGTDPTGCTCPSAGTCTDTC